MGLGVPCGDAVWVVHEGGVDDIMMLKKYRFNILCEQNEVASERGGFERWSVMLGKVVLWSPKNNARSCCPNPMFSRLSPLSLLASALESEPPGDSDIDTATIPEHNRHPESSIRGESPQVETCNPAASRENPETGKAVVEGDAPLAPGQAENADTATPPRTATPVVSSVSLLHATRSQQATVIRASPTPRSRSMSPPRTTLVLPDDIALRPRNERTVGSDHRGDLSRDGKQYDADRASLQTSGEPLKDGQRLDGCGGTFIGNRSTASSARSGRGRPCGALRLERQTESKPRPVSALQRTRIQRVLKTWSDFAHTIRQVYKVCARRTSQFLLSNDFHILSAHCAGLQNLVDQLLFKTRQGGRQTTPSPRVCC